MFTNTTTKEVFLVIRFAGSANPAFCKGVKIMFPVILKWEKVNCTLLVNYWSAWKLQQYNTYALFSSRKNCQNLFTSRHCSLLKILQLNSIFCLMQLCWCAVVLAVKDGTVLALSSPDRTVSPASAPFSNDSGVIILPFIEDFLTLLMLQTN